jgi:PASTA domain
MRPRGLAALSVALVTLILPASTLASQGGALEILGVPATLTIPGPGFTAEVKGTTGTSVEDKLDGAYGPDACQATFAEQLAHESFEEMLTGPDANEVPLRYFTGPFAVKITGLGEPLGRFTNPGPGHYRICLWLIEFLGGESTVATATATFTAVAAAATPTETPAATTTAPTVTPTVKHCLVHSLKGKTLAAAKQALVAAGCAVGRIRRTRSHRVRKGRVISQSSKAGLSLKPGTKISLTVSSG